MRRSDRQVTDIKAIDEILSTIKTCHLAMVDDGAPYVIPISYGYEFHDKEITLYFHCAHEGRKLDILKKNNKVCFEMNNEGEPTHPDNSCNSGYYYSSVIGNGEVEFIEDVTEKCHALSVMYEHQAGKPAAFNEAQASTVCVFEVRTTDFIGKKK